MGKSLGVAIPETPSQKATPKEFVDAALVEELQELAVQAQELA